MTPVRRRFRRLRIVCKQLNRFKSKPLTTRTMAETNRGTTWADKEVKTLLTIWGDSKIQEELDGAVRNKVVFECIAKKLQEQGYERDWKQCRAKVKNLKTKYREVKDNNDKTGRGRKSCEFYRELDEILGHRPASVSSALLDTGDFSSTLSESDAENEEDDMNGKETNMIQNIP